LKTVASGDGCTAVSPKSPIFQWLVWSMQNIVQFFWLRQAIKIAPKSTVKLEISSEKLSIYYLPNINDFFECKQQKQTSSFG
jgi:hypothetical protein